MPHSYDDNIFINCPYDPAYSQNLQAIVFSVYCCGFYPISALSEDNALINRLSKIEDLIAKCRFGIHDISRTELNTLGYPRFNMPFELGLFFGATRYGNAVQKTKNALIFEKVQFTYQNYLSDLSGVDTKAHNDDPSIIIKSVRDWLKSASDRHTIPGDLKIKSDFKIFQTQLPTNLVKLNLELADLTFNDLCGIVEEFLQVI